MTVHSYPCEKNGHKFMSLKNNLLGIFHLSLQSRFHSQDFFLINFKSFYCYFYIHYDSVNIQLNTKHSNFLPQVISWPLLWSFNLSNLRRSSLTWSRSNGLTSPLRPDRRTRSRRRSQMSSFLR